MSDEQKNLEVLGSFLCCIFSWVGCASSATYVQIILPLWAWGGPLRSQQPLRVLVREGPKGCWSSSGGKSCMPRPAALNQWLRSAGARDLQLLRLGGEV